MIDHATKCDSADLMLRSAHARSVRASRSMKALRYPLLRNTWMSRSRIFLRSVLRFTPSRSAARIWLPRVAASVTVSSGCSISRSTR